VPRGLSRLPRRPAKQPDRHREAARPSKAAMVLISAVSPDRR
jgi:hypothetical protein